MAAKSWGYIFKGDSHEQLLGGYRLIRAYMWFTVAERTASVNSGRIDFESMTPNQLSLVRKSINNVSQLMTTEQIVKAKAMAESCINKNYKKCE